MRLYGLLGRGASAYLCAKHGANQGGPGACSPREILFFDFLVDAIWWNLGLSKCLNRFTCKIEISAYPKGGGKPKPRGGANAPLLKETLRSSHLHNFNVHIPKQGAWEQDQEMVVSVVKSLTVIKLLILPLYTKMTALFWQNYGIKVT